MLPGYGVRYHPCNAESNLTAGGSVSLTRLRTGRRFLRGDGSYCTSLKCGYVRCRDRRRGGFSNVVKCARRNNRQGGGGIKERSAIVGEFKNIVADRRAPQREKDELARRAISGRLTPSEIANIFNCMKKGDYINVQFLEALAQKVFDSHDLVTRFDTIQMSMAIQSLAVMSTRVPQFFPSFQDFLGLLIGECLERERIGEQELNERSIANVVYALGLIFKRGRGVSLTPDMREFLILLLEKLTTSVGGDPPRLAKCKEQEVSNIVYGLAQLGYDNMDVLNVIGREIMRPSRLRKIRQQEISNIVYGFGLMGYDNPEVLDALSTVIGDEAVMIDFREQHLSNIVYAFSLLRYRNDRVLGALCSEIQMEERLRNFREQHLGNIMYGLGILKFNNGQILDVLGGEITRPERLPHFKEQELANIIYGFGLQEYDNKQILSTFCEEITHPTRLARFKEQEVSNIVYTLGLLRYGDHKVLDSLSTEIRSRRRLPHFIDQHLANMVYSFGILRYRNDEVLGALSGEIRRPEVLNECKVQALSNMVYGFALLDYRNGEVLDALCSEIQKPRRLEQFREQHLGNITYGFGLLQHYNEDVLHALGGEIVKEERLERYKDQELTNIMYGLALLKEPMESGFLFDNMLPLLNCLAKEILAQDRLDKMSINEVSTIGWAFAKLQYLDEELMDRLVDRFLALADTWGNTGFLPGMSMLLYACATLNHTHEDFLNMVCTWMMEGVEEMTVISHITTALWALSIIGHLPTQLFEKICGKLMSMGMEDMAMENYKQVSQACLYVKTLNGFEMNEQFVELIERIGEKYEGKMDALASRFETEVSGVLHEIGVAHKTHYEIVEACVVVDILVEKDGPIVIEADGPFHYTINEVNGSHGQLGGTCFRNWLVRNMGFKVLCVPFFKWGQMQLEERKEWITQEINNLR